MNKLLYIIGILVLAVLACSSINILPRSERYPHKSKGRNKSALSRLSNQNKRIEQLLLKRNNRPNFYDNTTSFGLSVGTTIQAHLLNSIISDNLDSPILIEVSNDAVFPIGTRFSCSGRQRKIRVYVACKLIILEGREYPLEAKVLNLDGSAGLKGKIFTGNDQRVASTLSTSIIKELANRLNNRQLKVIPSEISQIIDENSADSQESIVQIEAHDRVLVYLTKGFRQ